MNIFFPLEFLFIEYIEVSLNSIEFSSVGTFKCLVFQATSAVNAVVWNYGRVDVMHQAHGLLVSSFKTSQFTIGPPEIISRVPPDDFNLTETNKGAESNGFL